MKLSQPTQVSEIAQKYHAKLVGNASLLATGINEIHKVEKGDITFVDHPKYYQKSLQSAASIIIIDQETECPEGKALLIHDNPFEIYDAIIRSERPEIPMTAIVSDSAEIHPTAIIEPGVIIGDHVKIGAHSFIRAQVCIHEHTIIGEHVTIQSGCIIGSDAFYYKKVDGQYNKWRSGGRVMIEDHVEIGAGCTINKGVSGDTIIGEGSKFDCQIHIGHGVVIGKNCLLAAQVGIGGKTTIGDGVTIYGQVGIGQSLTIGDGATLLGKSGITKNIEGGKTYFGYPADEARSKYKELATLRKLSE